MPNLEGRMLGDAVGTALSARGEDGSPKRRPKPPVSEAARVKWSAVVINYNGAGQVVPTIELLRAVQPPPEEIIVVDDGSTDDSLALVRAACPEVRIVPLGRNTGRTGLVRNAGLRAAGQRFVLVTDNDIRFAPDAVLRLMEVMLAKEDAAACTPVVYYDDRPDEIFLRGHQLHYLCWSCPHPRTSRAEIEGGEPTPAIGCGIQLLDGDAVLGLGGFDENLHIGWGDDGELHHRLQDRRHGLLLDPGGQRVPCRASGSRSGASVRSTIASACWPSATRRARSWCSARRSSSSRRSSPSTCCSRDRGASTCAPCARSGPSGRN